MDTNLTRNFLALVARFLSGASVRWIDSQPDTCQRVYFANHTSHLDPIVIWSALPQAVRMLTRPVAAKDYWSKGPVRRYFANQLFNAILIDREEIKVHQSPVDMMIREIGHTHSLIVFPGGRAERRAGGRRVQERPVLPVQEAARPGADPRAHRQHEPHPAARRGAAGAAAELHQLRPAACGWRRARRRSISRPGPRGRAAAEGVGVAGREHFRPDEP